MNRAVRNRLVRLLLGAFENAADRDALLYLGLFFDLCDERSEARVRVRDLEAAWRRSYPGAEAQPRHAAAGTAALKGLLETRDPSGAQGPESPGGGTAWYEPHSDVRPFLPEVGDRVRLYAELVRQGAEGWRTFEGPGSLRRAVAQAAACFNARLFFEAHELLEDHWRGLSRTPTKRFVQGLIQVSVGFHHTMRGSYQGAVNQLGKGLAKLEDAPEGALGFDRDRFVREVAATRDEIVARWRERKRIDALQELPRMHLRS